MEAFRQRLQQEASSRLEPYSREVFLSVGIKESNKLLVRPLQYFLIDSYPVMSAQKCARQVSDGSWVNLFKSKAVYEPRKPGDTDEPKPPTYVEIGAKAEFCEKARLLPFEASVFKKHMLQGKEIPDFYLELFRKEEACGGPKLTDPITYVGLSKVLEVEELMFNRDAYYVTFGVDPLAFYIARPLETRLKMEAAFPAAPGLTISEYNFEASCPPAIQNRYKSFLPTENNSKDANAMAYPVLMADDYFVDLELHKYHPSNESFRETSGYRREFDWSKNPDYNRNLKHYMLTKASEKLQKPAHSTKDVLNQQDANRKEVVHRQGSAAGSVKTGLLAKLKSSSEGYKPSQVPPASSTTFDSDEINRDFSESLADFEAGKEVFSAPPPDDLPPPDLTELERRSVSGFSDLKREGRSFTSAAKDMGVEKTPSGNVWARERKPLPVFSAALVKNSPKQNQAPSWAQPKQTPPGVLPDATVAVDSTGSDCKKSTPPPAAQANKKPSILGLLQGSKEVSAPTPTSSMSM